MKAQRTGERVACHVRVAEVARAAAGELYESMMSNNDFFKIWQNQNKGCNAKELEKRFIDANWQRCIEFARMTLTVMLTQPQIADSMKDEIMEILEQDQSLRRVKAAPGGLNNGTPYGKLG